ncbi:20266_t:CDS:2, partial [Racocetra persica]
NNIDVENIKMDIDSKKRKLDIDTTENIQIDIDSKKIKLNVDYGDLNVFI